MLVFFAIFPPKEVSEEINLIRSYYDTKFTRLAPHITIIPPFTPKGDLAPAIEKLERVLKETDPFWVNLSGVGTFKKRFNNVAYLDVSEKELLLELQNKVSDVLGDYGAQRDDKQPTYHITIAKKLRLPNLNRIIEELTGLDFEAEFLAKYLAYCVIEKNEPWQIKELIPIGAVKNARNNTK